MWLFLQAKHLSSSFHCYAIDLRGMGDSHMDVLDTYLEYGAYVGSHKEWLRASSQLPTLEGFAADIVAVVEHLSWKGASFADQSALLAGGCLRKRTLGGGGVFTDSDQNKGVHNNLKICVGGENR